MSQHIVTLNFIDRQQADAFFDAYIAGALPAGTELDENPDRTYKNHNLMLQTQNVIGLTALGTYTPAPTGLNGAATAATTATINWTKAEGATGYTVERATNAAFSTGLTSTNVADVNTYNVTGLTTATTYYFRVKGTAPGKTSGASNVITITTP